MLTSRLRDPASTSRRAAASSRWLWLTPFAVSIVMRIVLELNLLGMAQILGIAVAIPALLAFARVPHLALRLFVLILPFQLVIMSVIYKVGVPSGFVRLLGLWKELAAASLVLAAWAAIARAPRRLDVLDRLALAYVALGTLYLVIPELLIPDDLGSSLSMDTRFIGWRTIVLPVLLLLAARHVRLSSSQVGTLMRTLAGVGVALGAIALFEFTLSGTWNSLMIDTFGVNRFRVDVLETSLSATHFQIDDVRVYGEVGGREFVRVGGPVVSYLTFGFLLLVCGSVLFEWLVRGIRSAYSTVGAVLVGLGVLLTQTRSAIVGGAVLVVAALRPGAGRAQSTRIRYTLLASAALVVAVPLMMGAGMLDRFSGDSESDDAHSDSFDLAYRVLNDNPLGRGLATGVSTAAVDDAIVAENQFLDVGVQLGWPGLVLFAAVLVALVLTLQRAAHRARAPSVRIGVFGMQSAFLALLVPCWFLQPFVTPAVGWTLFALTGAALGAADREAQEAREHADTELAIRS